MMPVPISLITVTLVSIFNNSPGLPKVVSLSPKQYTIDSDLFRILDSIQ